jgi:hypothetical protein
VTSGTSGDPIPNKDVPDPPDPPTRDQFEAERAKEVTAAGSPEPVGNLSDTNQPLDFNTFGGLFAHLDSEKNRALLQWRYGVTLLRVLVAQVFIADVIFVFVASSDKLQWDVPSAIMNLWIGATVVQVIGIVAIVIRFLFPKDAKAVPPQKKAKRGGK